VGAAGLANCNATCRVEARADGRWNGRNVSLLEAGVQMMDGMKMAGMIRYFYDHKGFGPSGCTGRDGGRPFCEMEHGLSNAGQSRGDLYARLQGFWRFLCIFLKE
jgi:hypothetical protein